MARLPDFKSESVAEHARLGLAGAHRLLDAGRRWDLAPVLRAGGAVIFPHIGLEACGAFTAAAVHACLDSGARRVLAIGVLHALTEELEQARVRVAQGADVALEPAWGIQGPGVTRSGLAPRTDWEHEFSLLDFLFLWRAEIERRGIAGPELIARYPYLAGGRPEILPGIDELEEIVRVEETADGEEVVRDAVLIATADPFHHGIGYGDPSERALAPEAAGLDLARRRIEEGLRILEPGDHWAYNQHCVSAKSDARDVGQVLRHLLGPLRGEILDLSWADTSASYGKPAPTWVAGALIALQPAR